MSNRCPSCEKMVSLEFQDIDECESFDGTVDDDAEEESEDGKPERSVHVNAEVRIVRCCADCGEEMKEATLEMEADETFSYSREEHNKEACGQFEVECDGIDQVEEGGGRYAKSYFGATVRVNVTCGCGETVHSFEMTDKVAASGMDELN